MICPLVTFSRTALEDYGLDLSSDDASSFNDNEQSAGQEQPSNWPEQRLALLRQLIPAFAALEQEKKETARLGKPAGTYDDAFTVRNKDCRAIKLPWIFQGAPLSYNGAPRNIQGNQ